MMQAEMKTAAPAQPPAIEPPAEQAEPASRGEAATCCAVQSGKVNYRPWLIGAAALGMGLALYGGWDWLAATGTAAVLIGLAPCLAMCALGLCAARAGKSKPDPTLADIRKTYETQSGEPPSRG